MVGRSNLHEKLLTLMQSFDGTRQRQTRSDPGISPYPQARRLLYYAPEAPLVTTWLRRPGEYSQIRHHRRSITGQDHIEQHGHPAFRSTNKACATVKEELTGVSCCRFYFLASSCIIYHWSQIEPATLIMNWRQLLPGMILEYGWFMRGCLA
jgi:hypothetical protein